MPNNHKNMDTQRGTNTPPNRDVNAANRVTLAVRLRSTRMTYDAIANQCGYSNASACRKAIMRELDRTVVKNVDALRTEEMDSLDRLEAECWKIFYDKNREKGQLFAADRILQIKERRAKLMGLDMRYEEAAVQQNYTKRIILQPTIPTGGDNGSSNG